jgi:uncharacterized protein
MATFSEFKPGRCLVGRLPHGQDLIHSIEAMCREASMCMAAFSLIGAVSSVTFGAYDQKQQVYVTMKEDAALEIISCTGNVSLKEGHPFVHAHILLADEQGKSLGGHLFSETIVYAGEICLQELVGPPLERVYDQTTGLMLWPV